MSAFTAITVIFLLLFLRVFVFTSAISVLSQQIGVSARLVFSLTLGVLCVAVLPGSDYERAIVLLRRQDSIEILILGSIFAEAILAWLLALPFALSLETFRMIGRFADASRGAQLGEQLDAQLGEPLSMLERFAAFSIVFWILHSGAYAYLLEPLVESSRRFGPSVLWLGQLHQLQWSTLLTQAIAFSGEIIAWAFLIAAPVVLVCLMIDLSTMVMMRALGKIHFSFELLPLKLVLGVFVLAGTIYAQWPASIEIIPSAARYSNDVFQEFGSLGGSDERG